jgi:hypothetical protein
MEYKFVKNMIDNNIFNKEMIINILLVLKGARKTTLLEYANVKNNMSHIDFFNSITTIINIFKSITGEQLSIYLENEEPYPRYLIYNFDKYPNMTQELQKEEHDFELGKILEMTFPGGNYYDYNQHRLTGLIMIGDINLFAEVFVVKDYEHEYKCLKKNLENKVNKWNLELKEIGLKCKYIIKSDDGFEYRKKKYEEKDIVYIRDHIDEYMNDHYNELI